MHPLQLAGRGLNIVLIRRDLSTLEHEAKAIGKEGKRGAGKVLGQGLGLDGGVAGGVAWGVIPDEV